MHDLALVPGVINIVYLIKSSSSLLIVVVSGASSTKVTGICTPGEEDLAVLPMFTVLDAFLHLCASSKLLLDGITC